MPNLTPGTIVRDRREARGLSRERVARLADVSTSLVTRLELQNQIPKVVALTRIATVLDIPLDELVAAIDAAEREAAAS